MRPHDSSSHFRFLEVLKSGSLALALVVAILDTAQAANQTWDPAANGTGSDGSGTWDTATPIWASPGDAVWTNGNTAVFGSGGTAGTVTVSPGIIAGGLTFNSGITGSYTIAGSSLSLGAAATPISVATGASAAVNSVLTGTNLGITVSGGGTLTFGGNNTYTGATILDGGTLGYSVNATGMKTFAFGVAPSASSASTNIGTLDLTNGSVTATGFTVQTNSATPNALKIGTGKTLTVNGAFTVGVGTVFSDANAGANTVLGVTGDSLVVNGVTNNFQVGVGRSNAATGNDPVAVLDMSGANITSTPLNNFTYAATTGEFRVGGGNLRATATLANNNNITAMAVRVGDSSVSGTGDNANNFGGQSLLHLGGGANVIQTQSLIIGATKGAGILDFATTATGGTLTLTGEAGGASTADIQVGSSSSSTGTNSDSQLNLNGHNVTIQANNLVLGRFVSSATAGNSARGTLRFDTGTISAVNVQMGLLSSSGTISSQLTSVVSGTLIMGGATAGNASATGVLNVSGAFNLANRTIGSANAAPASGTFIINGGTANINTDILDASTTVSGAGANTTTLTLDGGTLALMGHSIGTAAAPITNINLNTGTLSNALNISGKTITLQSAINISGAPTYIIASGGTLTSNLPMLTLGSGGGLSGGGVSLASITGDVVAASGAKIAPGSSSVASTLQFNNNLSLNGGSTVRLKLSENAGSGNDAINVAQNLTLAGTVNLEIGSVGAGPLFGNTYTLFSYGTLTGNETNFNVIAPVGTRSNFNLLPTASTSGLIQLQVTGTAPFSLTWIGNSNSNWDLKNAANWQDLSHGPGSQQFFNQDTVTFNDTSTNLSDVQLIGTLSPGNVTVSATRNYKFAGSGTIAGGALTKSGSGTLILATNNTYSGNTDIQAGTLQIGDGATVGSIGAGTISNNATLSYKRSDAITVANAISGGGIVRQDGTGTLTLSTANTFSGGLVVNSGAARLTNVTAAGSGAITVNSGGTLVYGATALNPLTLAGGTVGTTANLTAIALDITAAPATNSTIYLADPQNLPTTAGTDATEFSITGTLHGSGNITVLSNGQDAGPDAGNAFRLQGTGTSDFSGKVTLGNTVKGELKSTIVGPTVFSPAGTGTIALTAGVINPGALTGTFSELNLRNSTGASGGNVTFGNNVEIVGSGIAVINPLTDASGTTAPAGSVATMGNLKIGAGQTLAVGKNSAPSLSAAFQSVTLTGGIATFAPTPSGTAFSGTANLTLGAISEQTSGSGITMAGRGTLFLNGASTYTGPTTVSSGTLQLAASDVLPNNSKLVLAGGKFSTAGNNDTLGTLQLTNPGAIDLGAGASVLHFADSHLESWQGPVTISNWSGNLTTGGGTDQVFFGSTNAGLTGSQLSSVHFAGFNGATLLGSGEIIPNSISTRIRGDWNMDGTVDSNDVATMLTALTDLNAYASASSPLHTAYPQLLTSDDLLNVGDVNRSGSVSNGDIQALLDLVNGVPGAGSLTAVPEPSTLVLAVFGLTSAGLVRPRTRKKSSQPA